MQGHVKNILTSAFLELFSENPDVKDKFMGFKNYSVEDLQKGSDKGGECEELCIFQCSDRINTLLP